MERKTYTKTPVTTEARKVPNMANVTIAPKFEKKGFCKNPHFHRQNIRLKQQQQKNYKSIQEKKLWRDLQVQD